MAKINLYTGEFEKNKQSYNMCDFNNTGVWFSDDVITGYDYRLMTLFGYKNPLTEEQGYFIRINVPQKGINYINESDGDETCKLPDFVKLDEPYHLGYADETVKKTTLNSIFWNDQLKYNPYNYFGFTSEQYQGLDNNSWTDDVYEPSRKNEMCMHFYTYGGNYFTIKHLWQMFYNDSLYYDVAQPFVKQVVRTSNISWENIKDGVFHFGGKNGSVLNVNTNQLNNMFSQAAYKGFDYSENGLKSCYKIKFIAGTIPKEIKASYTNVDSEGNFTTAEVATSAESPEDINFIGIIIIYYSSDGIPISAEIQGMTLDFWKKEGSNIFNGGDDSGIEGGEGTFTTDSDIITPDDIIDSNHKKELDRTLILTSGTGGMTLWYDFSFQTLIPKLASKEFIDRYANIEYNPLSAVISAYQIPKYWNNSLIMEQKSTNKYPLQLSGYNTNVESYIGLSTVWSKRIATINLQNKYFDAFPDYEPYTKIVINLPFCGRVNISPNLCIGGKIDVYYSIDLLNGNVCSIIYTTDLNGVCIPSYTITGNCAFGVPLAGYQYGNPTSNIINTVTNGIASAITGSPIPVLSNIFNLSSTSLNKHSVEITGNVSGNSALYDDWRLWILITRPVWINSNKYNNMTGLPSYVSGTINSNDYDGMPFTGYLKCSKFHAENVTRATDNERSEIEKLLLNGIQI